MKKIVSLALVSFMAACQSPVTAPPAADMSAPASAVDALEAYYRTLPEDFFPRASAGAPLPSAETALSRILVGSCLDEVWISVPKLLLGVGPFKGVVHVQEPADLS
jgi:alkaline phosphatase D